jgi:SnoaL-like domain
MSHFNKAGVSSGADNLPKFNTALLAKTSSNGINVIDEDKAAILAVIKAETAAFMRKDIAGLAEHWIHSPEARRIAYVANLGLQVFEGWDAIKENYIHLIAQFPDIQPETRVHSERMNLVVIGDVAWANYDQIGNKTTFDDKFELGGKMHEIKIFHRIAGQWKMACIIVIQCSVEHVSAPLIEISADRHVLWMMAMPMSRS